MALGWFSISEFVELNCFISELSKPWSSWRNLCPGDLLFSGLAQIPRGGGEQLDQNNSMTKDDERMLYICLTVTLLKDQDSNTRFMFPDVLLRDPGFIHFSLWKSAAPLAALPSGQSGVGCPSVLLDWLDWLQRRLWGWIAFDWWIWARGKRSDEWKGREWKIKSPENP